jgi:hypothetical protein
MAARVDTSASIWVDAVDLTSLSTQYGIDNTADVLDATTFGSGGSRARLVGLKDGKAEVTGFWDSSADAVLFGTVLGSAAKVVTLAEGSIEGSPAFVMQGVESQYSQFGKIGDITPFKATLTGAGAYGVPRGKVTLASTSITTTGAKGTAVQLGAVAAGKYLYAAVHCFAAGTTVTIKIQSDDNIGFTTPTDVATLSAITAVGGTWMTRVAGPITDTYFRVNVSSITGTFQLASAIAIG